MAFFHTFALNPFKSIPMKKLVYSFGFVGLVISCGAPAEEPTTEPKDTTAVVVVPEVPVIENSFVLEAGVVGLFKIGQPMPQLPDVISSRKASITLNEDGAAVEHVMFVISNELSDIAEIVMTKNDSIYDEDLTIQQMNVISDYYETADNLKVGVYLATLLEKYPDAKIWYDGVNSEIVVETPAYDRVQFIINTESCTKPLKGTKNINLSATNFNEEAKIIAISVN